MASAFHCFSTDSVDPIFLIVIPTDRKVKAFWSFAGMMFV